VLLTGQTGEDEDCDRYGHHSHLHCIKKSSLNITLSF